MWILFLVHVAEDLPSLSFKGFFRGSYWRSFFSFFQWFWWKWLKWRGTLLSRFWKQNLLENIICFCSWMCFSEVLSLEPLFSNLNNSWISQHPSMWLPFSVFIAVYVVELVKWACWVMGQNGFWSKHNLFEFQEVVNHRTIHWENFKVRGPLTRLTCLESNIT